MAIAMTDNIKYFDTFEYIQQSKKIKDPGDLAAYQVQKIESAIETAVQHVGSRNDSTLSTKTELTDVKNELKSDIQEVRNELKSDIQEVGNELKSDIQEVRNELKSDIKDLRNELKSEMKDLRYDTLKFVIGSTTVATVTILGTVLGTLAKGFHWI